MEYFNGILEFCTTLVIHFLKIFRLILFTYSNPCDCLIQVWLVYLIRIPDYLYILGSPLFHFVLMTERVLATIFVKIYDKQGKMFGVTATIILVKNYSDIKSI
ncbi:unnamed protein product [Meloidogyne enterolobii]|uniref:Uncharacterized protein n=1 Tax=Meloidogyne enterolobii TaxID=390850 RepID=A0ACB0YDY7_MELEN